MSQSVVSAIKEAEAHTGKKHTLKILCRHYGDEEIEFDPKNKKEIEKAAKKFEAAKKDRGMIGYTIPEGGKGEANLVHEFDPKEKSTVMSAPIRGGF